MALFFDQAWFDGRLAASGSTRADLARLLGLSEKQIDDVWKDQRELRAGDVAALARFLNVSPAEIALRAGVSTPVPPSGEAAEGRMARLEARVDELEGQVRALLAQVRRDGLK